MLTPPAPAEDQRRAEQHEQQGPPRLGQDMRGRQRDQHRPDGHERGQPDKRTPQPAPAQGRHTPGELVPALQGRRPGVGREQREQPSRSPWRRRGPPPWSGRAAAEPGRRRNSGPRRDATPAGRRVRRSQRQQGCEGHQHGDQQREAESGEDERLVRQIGLHEAALHMPDLRGLDALPGPVQPRDDQRLRSVSQGAGERRRALR